VKGRAPDRQPQKGRRLAELRTAPTIDHECFAATP
jgi:hypothetical protein